MSLDAFLDALKTDRSLSDNVVAWHVAPGRNGSFAPFPDGVPSALRDVLARRGIARLYSHQAETCVHASAGRDTLIVTPTASGKSLSYNLPVLSSMLTEDADRRPTALYLFPTKALSQDQVAELHGLASELGDAIGCHTYDGDTPPDERRIARDRCDILVTNPYMLHVGILPNHARWVSFFRRLRWIVVDELHHYKGVFGSSVANVFRRLVRIARHHGGSPTFIACSATIHEPAAHFRRLTGRNPVVVDRNGAPAAERHHVFYNPPVMVPALGIRARAVDHVRKLTRRLMEQDVPSIVFGRSRSRVEVVTKYLRDAAAELGMPESKVATYRGGYLPALRREIEQGLRGGAIRMVAATNALELGVDIGALDAVVMMGYPGTIASYFQQAGRAGRRSGLSLSLLVGTSVPLDQFILTHPERVLAGVSESPVINPDNPVLLAQHVKCAAFELPFRRGDGFGDSPDAAELLRWLASEGGVLLERGDKYHWMADAYPAQDVSLDFVDPDSFIVLDTKDDTSLGMVARSDAATTIHEHAIYQHQGEQYHVEKLDWDGRRAYATRAAVDWYTDAETETKVAVLTEDERVETVAAIEGRGDVHVTTLATVFKRIRFYTHETLDSGNIALPPEELDTTAMWFALSEELVMRARLREGTRAGAVPGIAHLLRGLAPIFVRCSPADVRGFGEFEHDHFERPVIMLMDSVRGGVGFAETFFAKRRELVLAARDALAKCPCELGCPSCIGLNRGGRESKEAAGVVLDLLAAWSGTVRTASEETWEARS